MNWIQTTLEDFHAGTGFRVDVEQTPGSIALSREGDNYITEGTFESSSFDSGCLSNFDAIWWDATVLNEGELKFQIPTSENGETWTGLLGPDGTSLPARRWAAFQPPTQTLARPLRVVWRKVTSATLYLFRSQDENLLTCGLYQSII